MKEDNLILQSGVNDYMNGSDYVDLILNDNFKHTSETINSYNLGCYGCLLKQASINCQYLMGYVLVNRGKKIGVNFEGGKCATFKMNSSEGYIYRYVTPPKI